MEIIISRKMLVEVMALSRSQGLGDLAIKSADDYCVSLLPSGSQAQAILQAELPVLDLIRI